MTEREVELIKQMWSQGYSATQIARVLPYKEYWSKAEIRRFKKEGILPPRNVKEIRVASVLAEFEKNKNLRQIADKLGIEYSYVLRILHDEGVKHPKVMNFTKAPPTQRRLEIIEDLKKGMSLSEVAKKHGISRQRVFQIKESYNNEQ